MRIFSTILLALTIGFASFAQDDAKAKDIVTKLTRKTKSYSSIYVEFTAKIKNSSINETSKGKGWLKGDKYKAEFGEYRVLSNNVKVWTISTADKEVYVSSVGEDEDVINPKELLTQWETGFKYKYVKEETINGKKYHRINLYPKDAKKAKYHTVTLLVDVAQNQIYQVVLKSNDATTSTYTITTFKSNETYSDDMFIFDKRKYPGYEVIY